MGLPKSAGYLDRAGGARGKVVKGSRREVQVGQIQIVWQSLPPMQFGFEV